MSDRKCARVLIEAARRDLEIVEVMLEHRAGSDEVFGFHVQQAAGKLLKAWLAVRGATYPLTHDIEALLGTLSERENVDLAEFWELASYTPFAVIHRYEAMGAHEPPMQRRKAHSCARALLGQVSEVLEDSIQA